MKTNASFRRSFAPTLIVLFAVVLSAPADEKVAQKPTAGKPAAAAVAGAKVSEATVKEGTKAKAHVLPKGIEEIVKMSEAGVSVGIVTKYIETSGVAYEPTGPDIIAMKERGVPDEVTIVMLARSSAIRAQFEESRNKIAAPAIVRTLATDGELDPESYEFFWYHHAYPRVLAGSYQTLAPYTYTRGYGSRRSLNQGPIWRTDGFARESFAPGRSLKNEPAKPRP